MKPNEDQENVELKRRKILLIIWKDRAKETKGYLILVEANYIYVEENNRKLLDTREYLKNQRIPQDSREYL